MQSLRKILSNVYLCGKIAVSAQNFELCVDSRGAIVHGILHNVYRINEAFSSSPFTHYFDFAHFSHHMCLPLCRVCV